MEYISLYRKYRPTTFNEVVGQEIVVKILQNSILNNKISHAYLFSGPRGTGKTSIAKIFSKAINCLNNSGDVCNNCDVCNKKFDELIDIVEIDAASNNGVDEIREIRNNSKLLPSVLKYKVYIVDEVHMLSTSAFNALLKTLEEPPKHVIFILATTEINKIPSTVLSRCQKFDFKKISESDIEKRLKYILDVENKKLNDNIIKLIAKLGEGGLRDSINLLDQALSLNKEDIVEDDIYNLIGDVNSKDIFNLFDSIVHSDIKNVINNINSYYERGINITNIVNKLESIVKDLLIFNSTDNYFDKEYESKLLNYSKIDLSSLIDFSNELFELGYNLRKGNNHRNLVEIYFLRIALLFNNNKVEIKNELSEKITEVEKDKKKSEVENDNNISDDEKKLLINNALALANKKEKESFITKYETIREYITDKKYISLVNLLIKATPEVVSNKNILFTFKNDFEIVLFEKNISDIIKFLKKLFDKKYDIVAVTEEEWLSIKEKYIKDISDGIKYEYIENKSTKKNNKKNTELQSSIENIFGEEYIN